MKSEDLRRGNFVKKKAISEEGGSFIDNNIYVVNAVLPKSVQAYNIKGLSSVYIPISQIEGITATEEMLKVLGFYKDKDNYMIRHTGRETPVIKVKFSAWDEALIGMTYEIEKKYHMILITKCKYLHEIQNFMWDLFKIRAHAEDQNLSEQKVIE